MSQQAEEVKQVDLASLPPRELAECVMYHLEVTGKDGKTRVCMSLSPNKTCMNVAFKDNLGSFTTVPLSDLFTTR